jgi:4-diphosphocytidyl-2-C-methyl-D-erythritol kinase
MPPGSPDAVIRALDAPDVSGLAAAMRNNLEAAAMSVTPEVGQVLEWMRTRSGVSNALIAGSGSTVFALCRSDEVARGITESAAGFGWWSAATRLGAHGVRLKPEEEVR